MNELSMTTVGAVEVDGHLVGYLYLIEPEVAPPGASWRYVENHSGASYSHGDLVVLLGLIKSSLRVARWQSVQVVAIGNAR